MTGSFHLVVPFLIGLMLRAIPNLITPYPIGYDTVRDAWIISDLPRYLSDPNILWQTPLLYLLFGAVQQILPIDAFMVFRLLQPVLYGFLIAAFYYFVQRITTWSWRWVLLASVLFAVQTPTLRLSWDLHRNTLSLALLCFMLGVFHTRPRRPYVLAALALLVVFSHQMTAVILFTIVLGISIRRILQRDYDQVKQLLIPTLPALLLFLGVGLHFAGVFVFDSVTPVDVSPLVIIVPESSNASFPFLNYLAGDYYVNYQNSYLLLLADVASLYLASFILVLPLLRLGIRQAATPSLVIWTSFCSAAAFFPLLLPWSALLLWDRWMQLLVVPYTLYAVYGLRTLKQPCHRLPVRKGLAVFCALLVGFGILYVASPSTFPISTPTVFFPASKYSPITLLRHTTPLEDTPHIVNGLQWLNTQMGDDACLLARTTFLPWAQFRLNADAHVINYRNERVEMGLSYAQSLNYTEIYWLWWTNGVGLHWYGQSVPAAFTPVYQSGAIVVYRFRKYRSPS